MTVGKMTLEGTKSMLLDISNHLKLILLAFVRQFQQ